MMLPWSAAAQMRSVPQSEAQLQLSYAPVVKQTAPAVVNIYTKRKVVEQRGLSPLFSDPFFQQFFGNRLGGSMQRERVVSSLGSGVIVSDSGHVVTSFHVIKGAEDIIIGLSDRREFSAQVARVDEQSDLALLEMDTEGEQLPHLPIHDSDLLEVGDLVLAIGNPFGVGQTVSSGIISALARSVQGVSDYQFFIQTDAAINPGNSGGALVDMQGRLIGINTAIYTRSGGSNGIGFAIPANMVQALLHGTARDGRVVKPWLGAKYSPVNREIAESLDLEAVRGVLVETVYPDSPAHKGGLRAGDIITAVDGQPVDDVQALRFRIAIAELGEDTELNVLRRGRNKTLRVQLTTPPEDPPRDERELQGVHPLAGLRVANLNPALAVELGVDLSARGVVIMENNGGGGFGGFRAGDIILAVNKVKVTSTEQLERLLRGTRSAGWLISYQRGGRVLNLQVIR